MKNSSVLALILTLCLLAMAGCQKSEEIILKEKEVCIAYKIYILKGADLLMKGRSIDAIMSVKSDALPAKAKKMAPELMRYVADNLTKLTFEEIDAELNNKCEKLY